MTFATSQRAADERESELKGARRTLEERLSTVEGEKVRQKAAVEITVRTVVNLSRYLSRVWWNTVGLADFSRVQHRIYRRVWCRVSCKISF